MSKTESVTFLELYNDGKELEWSYDKITWHPLTEEPIIGDGRWYREKAQEPIKDTVDIITLI